MKVWGLILLLLLPGPVLGRQQYYGTTLSELAMSGAADESDLQKIPLKPGDTITSENVRASIQALYSTGSYRYIEVEATPAPGGTRLTFRVRPNFFFSTFRLEPELIDRPISAYFRLPLGEK